MLAQVFATKRTMTQAWTKSGKRIAVTRVNVVNNVVISEQKSADQSKKLLEIGYGTKKLKNMSKPLRSKLEKGGFSLGVQKITGVHVDAAETITVGHTVKAEHLLQIGDVVQVQGVTKGRGFAGAVKRYGFKGGPKTHGQSDRQRAVGAIGQRTTPGRVFVGKRMPGHYGVDTQSVLGLVVLHIDPSTQEIWLSGPVPGHINSLLTITKTGKTKSMDIDMVASGVKEVKSEPVVETAPEVASETTPVEAEGAAQ